MKLTAELLKKLIKEEADKMKIEEMSAEHRSKFDLVSMPLVDEKGNLTGKPVDGYEVYIVYNETDHPNLVFAAFDSLEAAKQVAATKQKDKIRGMSDLEKEYVNYVVAGLNINK
jgi:hypothetical protein